MQYDARRSDPSKSAKPGAEVPNEGPLLRERLLDVVRRDRAIAAIAVAQREAERDAETAKQPDPALDPEAKSGTHVRLPGYTRGGATEPEQERPSIAAALTTELPDNAAELTPAVSLFASWIEEEIIEIDGSSDMPIIFMPEPPPLPDAARRGAKAPKVLEPVAEPAPLEQGLELILEADAEPPKQEPIRTRTMARLLAGHGYPGRALSIYDHLIARDPSDVSLRVEADALRASKK